MPWCEDQRIQQNVGIPIALFGLVMFTFILIATIIREVLPSHGDVIRTGILVSQISAVFYPAYLAWLELNVIHAVCQWCVASSIVTMLLFVVEACRWYRSYTELGSE